MTKIEEALSAVDDMAHCGFVSDLCRVLAQSYRELQKEIARLKSQSNSHRDAQIDAEKKLLDMRDMYAKSWKINEGLRKEIDTMASACQSKKCLDIQEAIVRTWEEAAMVFQNWPHISDICEAKADEARGGWK